MATVFGVQLGHTNQTKMVYNQAISKIIEVCIIFFKVHGHNSLFTVYLIC